MIHLAMAAMINCSISNQSSLITPREVSRIYRVCRNYSKIVQNEWNMPGHTLHITLANDLGPEYSGDKYKDWVGFHATGSVIRINVKKWYESGNTDIMYPLTHEIAEAIVMPNPTPEGDNEIADPVNGDGFDLMGYNVAAFLKPDKTEYGINNQKELK